MKCTTIAIVLACGMIGVGIGWAVDRRSYMDRYQAVIHEARAIHSAIAVSIYMNKIYYQQMTLDPDDFAAEREIELQLNIIGLFENMDLAAGETKLGRYFLTEQEHMKSLEQVGHSLEILGFHDVNAYANRFVSLFRDTRDFAALMNSDRSGLSPSFESFVVEAIEAFKNASEQ